MAKCSTNSVKCIVCGRTMAKVHEPPSNVLDLVANTIDESILYANTQDQCDDVGNQLDMCDWSCCELCWYGITHNGHEYIWSGKSLMVYNRKEGEWFEYMGIVYKPARPVAIQFEWDEFRLIWQVEPRGG